MLSQVLAVRDSAMDAFSRPFFAPTVAMAMRSFAEEVNRAESEMFKHPADYELFHLATFDEDSGKFDNLPSPRSVVRAVDCVKGE